MIDHGAAMHPQVPPHDSIWTPHTPVWPRENLPLFYLKKKKIKHNCRLRYQGYIFAGNLVWFGLRCEYNLYSHIGLLWN